MNKLAEETQKKIASWGMGRNILDSDYVVRIEQACEQQKQLNKPFSLFKVLASISIVSLVIYGLIMIIGV